MDTELKQILTGAVIFGLITWVIILTTDNNINLSSNIEDRNAQYNQ